MKLTGWRKFRKTCAVVKVGIALAFGIIASGLAVNTVHPQRAFADVPAAVDFSQSFRTMNRIAQGPKMQRLGKHASYALFVTFYGDGRQEWLAREVGDDAITGFAMGHGAWALDTELSLFVEMPVYVRTVTQHDAQGAGLFV